MSHYRHRRGSTARQFAWFLTAIAAIGVIAVADDLIRHGFLAVLALAGPLAGYAAGRVHAARKTTRHAVPRGRVIRARAVDDGQVLGLRAEVEALRAERDQLAEQAAITGPGHGAAPAASGGATRDRLLATPRSGARPLGDAQ